jgi:hypothetical protein
MSCVRITVLALFLVLVAAQAIVDHCPNGGRCCFGHCFPDDKADVTRKRAGHELFTQTFKVSVRGDVVAAGVGLRGPGAGTISLTGIPNGASIVQAFLYWGTLGNDAFPTITFNGNPLTGSLIGSAGDTCWGVPNNFVHRADVTSIVSANGNDDYTIAGLPANDDPDNPAFEGNGSQGASLTVIFADGGDERVITILDGALTLSGGSNSFSAEFASPNILSYDDIIMVWAMDNLSGVVCHFKAKC